MLDTPSFPKRYIPQNMDGFSVKTNAPTNWETTYSAEIQAKQISPENYVRSDIDTATLQSTHWTTGNERSDMISETKDKYRQYSNIEDSRQPVRTRDQLMKSSFVLGDGSPMETRASLREKKSIQADQNLPRTGIHQELVSSHIDLGMGGGHSQWETTTQASYKPYQSSIPAAMNPNFQSGHGAREALRSDYITNTYQTENQANFVNYNSRPEPINQQERLTRLRNSQIQIGDSNANYFQTTNQTDFVKLPIQPIDPQIAKAARDRLSRSQIYDGKKEPLNTQTSYNETFKEYKGYKPPAAAERSAFVSHHDFRDCKDTFQSESREAYQPHHITRTPQADLHLTNTHIAIGAPGYGEMRSLYRDTFKGEQGEDQRIDPAEVRMFNTAHHSKVNDDTDHSTMMTTSQATYVHHKNVQPTEPCNWNYNEHTITPADPTLTNMTSESHAAYVHHKGAVANKPINNSLQESHINIAGGQVDQWKTTQQDYFRFKTFKFD
ncbi:hypothetical protein TRFO_40741 [Tritrichomonas foetus]|uniref:Uncharacterized protein n=1 Tax=Tritrichomonas foetus TaxID=1144522 RepID=A0A1J4J641_9EUKA|nr:hypothetical protein TRFO_40741 [Tritrichomonas foetus]|eukprot:OHS92917.1 hypothetical protein TRFO_40741 [Tritrichomonas foetus]